MGREVKGARSQKVPASICCLTYIAALVSIAVVFIISPCETAYMNGFAAHIVSTFVVFFFSCAYGNSSLYDPAWYLLPVGVGAGWLFAGGFSVRGVAAFAGLVCWASRFCLQWPWEGWHAGVEREDWRYVDFSDKISNNAAYWAWSLFGFHLVPTFMVFAGLQPVEAIWSAGADQTALGLLDLVAIAVTFAAAAIAYIADKQLSDFRFKDYGNT